MCSCASFQSVVVLPTHPIPLAPTTSVIRDPCWSPCCSTYSRSVAISLPSIVLRDEKCKWTGNPNFGMELKSFLKRSFSSTTLLRFSIISAEVHTESNLYQRACASCHVRSSQNGIYPSTVLFWHWRYFWDAFILSFDPRESLWKRWAIFASSIQVCYSKTQSLLNTSLETCTDQPDWQRLSCVQ